MSITFARYASIFSNYHKIKNFIRVILPRTPLNLTARCLSQTFCFNLSKPEMTLSIRSLELSYFSVSNVFFSCQNRRAKIVFVLLKPYVINMRVCRRRSKRNIVWSKKSRHFSGRRNIRGSQTSEHDCALKSQGLQPKVDFWIKFAVVNTRPTFTQRDRFPHVQRWRHPLLLNLFGQHFFPFSMVI